jgi:5-methylcytosine-specific restriction endonuclease McrA
MAVCWICHRENMEALRDRVQARLDLHNSPDPEKRHRATRWLLLLIRLRMSPRRGTWTVRSFSEIHHIRPKRDGGGNDRGNLSVLCRPCHRKETAKMYGVS